MQGTDRTFFYAARSYGVNQLVLCLVESPFLDSWGARFAYLRAKAEERRLRLYEMDLKWLDVKRHYDGLPKPSDVANDRKEQDTRSAEQIKQDVLKKLGVDVNAVV